MTHGRLELSNTLTEGERNEEQRLNQRIIVLNNEMSADRMKPAPNSAQLEQLAVRNLLGLGPSLWIFARVPDIAPDNNVAERPLRRTVIWRRKSFGTQSESGSQFVERILTAITTLRQQRRDVPDYLTAVCTSVNQAGNSICLVPDSS